MQKLKKLDKIFSFGIMPKSFNLDIPKVEILETLLEKQKTNIKKKEGFIQKDTLNETEETEYDEELELGSADRFIGALGQDSSGNPIKKSNLPDLIGILKIRCQHCDKDLKVFISDLSDLLGGVTCFSCRATIDYEDPVFRKMNGLPVMLEADTFIDELAQSLVKFFIEDTNTNLTIFDVDGEEKIRLRSEQELVQHATLEIKCPSCTRTTNYLTSSIEDASGLDDTDFEDIKDDSKLRAYKLKLILKTTVTAVCGVCKETLEISILECPNIVSGLNKFGLLPNNKTSEPYDEEEE